MKTSCIKQFMDINNPLKSGEFNGLIFLIFAERMGFEPTMQLPTY